MLRHNLYSINNKETLIHEKVHIFQRYYPDLFAHLYSYYWFFQKKYIKNINIINNIARTNPDALENNWVFTYNNINIILVSIYENNPSSIANVNNYGVYLDKNYNIQEPLKMKPLNKIKQFTNFFGNSYTNNYHPNEISADMIAKHILNIYNRNSKAYSNFKLWWNKVN